MGNTPSEGAMHHLPTDIVDFLEGYPYHRAEDEDTSSNYNLLFYSNQCASMPDNLLIDEFHEQWAGAYWKLERNHGFIQWWFPIREYGMNYESEPLQRHEIASMTSSPQIITRLIKSYEIMLDFYGMHLLNKDTGLLGRCEMPQDFRIHYRNLVHSMHNNLRISRILKCLSELGLERLNTGFLLHVLNEQSEHAMLNSKAIRSSMDTWWANCIRNDQERNYIGSMIHEVRRGRLVFTRKLYEDMLERRARIGELSIAEKEPVVVETSSESEDSVTADPE